MQMFVSGPDHLRRDPNHENGGSGPAFSHSQCQSPDTGFLIASATEKSKPSMAVHVQAQTLPPVPLLHHPGHLLGRDHPWMKPKLPGPGASLGLPSLVDNTGHFKSPGLWEKIHTQCCREGSLQSELEL